MMIQIHPGATPERDGSGAVLNSQLTDVMYIDPTKVESLAEMKKSDVWVLQMVSGNLFAIRTAEFLEFSHLWL